VLNIAQRCAFFCFALPSSSAFFTLKRRGEREKNDRDGSYKKEARKKKSNFNQPCTDFIDCVVVKTSEKVIQYVGAVPSSVSLQLFCTRDKTRTVSVTWRILPLGKQVRVHEDLAAGALHSAHSNDRTHSHHTSTYMHLCIFMYVYRMLLHKLQLARYIDFSIITTP
jgi:hypothetical protein